MNTSAIVFPSLLDEGSTDIPFAQEGSPPAPIQGEELVVGADGRLRPSWVGHDPLLEDYYDNEWGQVLTDQQDLFELQSLLIFQAGLRWRSILLRRSRLRAAMQGFSVGYLSLLHAGDVDRLLEDPRMIRNRRKIEAVINNAKAVRELGEYPGGFAGLIWDHQPDWTPRPQSTSDLPASTPESEALAKALKERGFKFIGPKSTFALMQAAGVVDGNPLGASNRGKSGLWAPDGKRKLRPPIPRTTSGSRVGNASESRVA